MDARKSWVDESGRAELVRLEREAPRGELMVHSDADAAFIAAARSAVPQLLDENDRLLARVEALEHDLATVEAANDGLRGDKAALLAVARLALDAGGRAVEVYLTRSHSQSVITARILLDKIDALPLALREEVGRDG